MDSHYMNTSIPSSVWAVFAIVMIVQATGTLSDEPYTFQQNLPRETSDFYREGLRVVVAGEPAARRLDKCLLYEIEENRP